MFNNNTYHDNILVLKLSFFRNILAFLLPLLSLGSIVFQGQMNLVPPKSNNYNCPLIGTLFDILLPNPSTSYFLILDLLYNSQCHFQDSLFIVLLKKKIIKWHFEKYYFVIKLIIKILWTCVYFEHKIQKLLSYTFRFIVNVF